ncbi:DUF6421 family protein [Streptomyces sp. NPDC051567]|uniref:DUF6421 family protein n=1 Tax=Streptomyces sp. NPDC051567 TaxID=3365660 RepID=UPI003792400E
MTYTNDDMADTFDEVNAIREELCGDRSAFRDPDFLKRLGARVERTHALRRRPIVRAFLEDIRQFTGGARLTATKNHINERRDNHLFSLFDASYFPSLSLDYLTYETLPTDPHLADRYASNTMPVLVTRRSRGFDARAVVALFPENQIDGSQQPDDLIFYFIDKFVERHFAITRTMIRHVMADGSFPTLSDASEAEVRQASSWWVRLHEYHHRQGPMPIPEFLSAKKSKPLAGLEELRVDVCGMLACLHDTRLPTAQARRAYEFILAERLLRYAVEGIPRPNYDAVASQLLFHYLARRGAIVLEGGIIRLGGGLPTALADFLAEIQAIEHRIHQEPVDAVKKRLRAFTDEYTDYDPEIRDYRHIPFFADVKSRLGV